MNSASCRWNSSGVCGPLVLILLIFFAPLLLISNSGWPSPAVSFALQRFNISFKTLRCGIAAFAYNDHVSSGISDPNRFAAAIARFDQDNAADPNVERVGGNSEPRELFFALKLSEWVLMLCPNA